MKKKITSEFWNKIASEPKEVFFIHNGLECRIARQPFSQTYCGYVGLPESHCLYGIHYMDLPEDVDMVHGGITYSDKAYWDKESELWWFGFDTNHFGDYSPARHNMGGEYRDFKYVEWQTKRFATLLKDYKLEEI